MGNQRNNHGRKVVVIIGALVLVTALVVGLSIRLKGHNNLSVGSTMTAPEPPYFQPQHRLPGIGADRASMDEATLALRTQHLIEAQDFGILRNSDGEKDDALIWARQVSTPELQKIIEDASHTSGFPADLIEQIIFIESGGNPTAKSGTGPFGLMQLNKHMGSFLNLIRKEVRKVKVKTRPPTGGASHAKGKGKTKPKGNKKPQPKTKTVTRTVVVDDRGNPKLSIPRAAQQLQDTARRYQRLYHLSEKASQQFAVWEWHSGQPVVDKALELAKEGGMTDITLPKVFFLNSPGYNPKLFEFIQKDLGSDYGSTYWFRVMRAGQLLALYRKDPTAYVALMDKYKSNVPGVKKAASRLEIWYSLNGSYQNLDDLKAAIASKGLVHPPNNPAYFSYALRMEDADGIGAQDPANRQFYATDPPAVVGALLYVAFETRRGWEQSHPTGEQFVPLEVTSMIRTAEYQRSLHKVNGNSHTRFPSHTVGAVDISFAHLPKGEEAWLRFVLQNLEFEEHVGYFDECKGQETKHFAPSPYHSDFFTAVYNEALASSR